jgi:hypothetical protein
MLVERSLLHVGSYFTPSIPMGTYFITNVNLSQFDFITYYHIPRSYNHVSNAYANNVLDWHLSH